MFTVCPKCTLTLAVTANDLRVGQGYVRCGRCANVFNALLTLSEEPTDAAPAPRAAGPSAASHGASPPAATGSGPASAAAHTQALPADGPSTHLPTELSFDGSIENESNRAEGTGTFETILLEGDTITQTEEYVPEASVKSEIAALTMRLGVPAHELSAPEDADGAGPGPGDISAADIALADTDPERESLTALDLASTPLLEPRRNARRWAWIAGSLLLALVLAAQAIHHWRDTLARSPMLNRPLSRLYASLGVPLDPHWDLAAYDVRQLGATVDPNDGGAIRVRLSVANRAPRPQPTPMLRLTLLDRYGKRIATRELRAQEYLPGNVPQPAFLARGQRVETVLTVRDPGSDSASFELDVCLSVQAQVRCAADAVAPGGAVATRKP